LPLTYEHLAAESGRGFNLLCIMIGDHENPHLREVERRPAGLAVGDTTLVIVAFMVSAGLVVALVVTLALWLT
jgi:hypothetical protein